MMANVFISATVLLPPLLVLSCLYTAAYPFLLLYDIVRNSTVKEDCAEKLFDLAAPLYRFIIELDSNDEEELKVLRHSIYQYKNERD